MTFTRWLQDHFVTPDAVYGLILYSALIGGVSGDNNNAVEVLVISVVSLLIFWGAHVFAATITRHGVKNGEEVSLKEARRRAYRHSAGMLYAAVLPSIPLVIGAFGILHVDDAVDISLLIAMVVLGVLGYQSFSERGAKIVVRILGALGTAFFGFLMIVLNTIVH
ncbi:MAG: hypothetical protein Q8M65_07370 [Rhodoglobus sp.]|nr:hypothetical protein [Rhodoglobus sp.]